jgi:hypothetical protein
MEPEFFHLKDSTSIQKTIINVYIILIEIQIPIKLPVIVFEDNAPLIHVTTNETAQHNKCKHFIMLVNYIKEHNLIEIDTKHKIIPDDKLKNLLGIQNEEFYDLTYFNIQKYMNKHFHSKENNLHI